jgi:hypothetical protein
MSIDLDPRPSAAEDYERYRSLSTAAVAGLIVGLLGWLAILDWVLVFIPALGVVLCAFAWRKVARHRDELTGDGLARAGFVLSLVFLIAGPGWLTYEYVTEVPEGYRRIGYAELQPDPAEVGQVVPPWAMQLEGKQVFIKGYVYPGREKDGIRQFLLCRDQGDCCFGGNPKITERIEVTLVDPLRLTYEPRIHKVGGVFHVEPQSTAAGGAVGGVLYHLTADHLE